MTPIIYGIKNCDVMKKARDWLKDHAIDAEFHDYKLSGIDATRLKNWSDQVGWEKLLNRAGTTFRALPEADKADTNEVRAIALMQAHTSLIKRPVLETDGGLLVGFKPEVYAAHFRVS